MKVHVPNIPEEGLTVELDGKIPWVRQCMTDRLNEVCDSDAPASGRLQIVRTQENVTLHGFFNLPLNQTCDRCAQAFKQDFEIPLTRHMAPFFPNPESREGEEVELTDEDLGFSFYHHEEIDLSSLLSEEVLLALPMTHLCREDCKGLCPRCGANLNENPCSCEAVIEDSPFAALKDLKTRPQAKN